MVSKYRSVLSAPGASRLFASALVARLPQGMSSLAILLLVRSTTHSYAAAGVAVGGFALATAACAPLLGRLVDHFGRTRVLLPFACGQACVYVLLVVARACRRRRRRARRPVGAVRRAAAADRAGGESAAARGVRRSVRARHRIRARVDAPGDRLDRSVRCSSPLVIAVYLAGGGGGDARRGMHRRDLCCSCARRPCARRSTSYGAGDERVSALASPELRALLGPMALMGVALGRGRGRATVVGPPCRVPAGVGAVARAVEPREHGRRALVWRARVALVAVDAVPAAARRAPGLHGCR